MDNYRRKPHFDGVWAKKSYRNDLKKCTNEMRENLSDNRYETRQWT